MTQFIHNYIASLTGFYFEKPVIERIAIERGVNSVSDYSDLTQKDKDLIMADLLYTAFFMPSQTASYSKKHGSFSVSVGGQTITNRAYLWQEMKRLYAKWGEDKIDGSAEYGGLQWME